MQGNDDLGGFASSLHIKWSSSSLRTAVQSATQRYPSSHHFNFTIKHESADRVQVAQLVLLAQVGAWVPASSMSLTVVDALHTRMGAHDNILQGRSTFLEELLDASALLAAATPRSLVILDELGRGTATHDGVAIAVAAMEALVARRCACLFVTHYPEACPLLLIFLMLSWPTTFAAAACTHACSLAPIRLVTKF
jgi:MutS domain V